MFSSVHGIVGCFFLFLISISIYASKTNYINGSKITREQQRQMNRPRAGQVILNRREVKD